MENGPSNQNGEEKQIWERPWTLEEMRKNSANWSLAADSGLFLFLQDFSQRMLSKTHEIEKQLDGLIRDTKATDSCLHTVFNDFLMLSNTQFIENRVYDEEVEEPPAKLEPERQSELEKTREQKEAELIPKVQEAVNYGLQVLDSAFEQLDIKAGNSDSEDEEATDRVEPILEPKDLYVDRPLPYLIGSQLFMETDDVGLGDLSSEEMSIDSDRDSVAESEEDKDRDQSDDDFNPDEDGKGSLKKKSSLLSYEDDEEEEEDEDSDIFGDSDKDEDGDAKMSGPPSSFADELAARIKGEPVNKPEPARAASSSISSISKKKSKSSKAARPPVEAAADEDDDDDTLFKPPKMEDDDDYSPFGGKGGLFSGGKGLFDDDDEADLFTETPRREPHVNTAPGAEPVKSKKIPTSGVSVFPENSLFGSPNDSDSADKDNGDPFKPKPPPMPTQSSGGGGLFDEDEEEDDFFSGKAIKKITSNQQKPQAKKSVDLFGGDEDLFNEGSSPAPASQKEPPEDEPIKTAVPEKKLPAGAISMFGPGTKSLLVEGLKKRQPSTSEDSEKSESEPPVASKPAASQPPEKKTQSRGLFSDDEDSQIFPSMTKSQSKPEPTTQAKVNKASLFDDEDEEDLFSSVPKAKSSQPPTKAKQVSKPASSSLFSDDEDQWMSSSASKDTKASSMKTSISAPSSLPSVKAAPKVSLFDDDDGDDLFAATKEASQKKQQRASLLFEDDTEDEKESLFGSKPARSSSDVTSSQDAAAAAAPTADLVATPLPAGKSPGEMPPVSLPSEEAMEEPKATKEPSSSPSPSQDAGEVRKKPAGAVSLFGGINVLAEKPDVLPSKTAVGIDGGGDEDDDDFLGKEPPPSFTKSAKKTTLSLFDDDNDEEDEDDTTGDCLVSAASKPPVKNTLKESKHSSKSTGVFQDEELLFSQTQQRDNDPDVDLFAATVKPTSPPASAGKSLAHSLFGEEEDDDLFATAKPKAPPKVAEKPVKPLKDDASIKPTIGTQSSENEKTKRVEPKGPSSRIGQLQASLAINPSRMLPGAAPPPHIPGAVSVLPGLPVPSSTPTSASAALVLPSSAGVTSTKQQTPTEAGVSFDSPAQVHTLHSANKGRTKGSIRRRPQTRAARQQAAQRAEEPGPEEGASGEAAPTAASSSHFPSNATASSSSSSSSFHSSSPPSASLSPSGDAATTPSSSSSSIFHSAAPALPALAAAPRREENSDSQVVRPKRAPPLAAVVADDDLFGSDDLFAPAPPKLTPSPKPKAKVSSEAPTAVPSKDPALSIFDDPGDDLFKKVKQKPAKKAKATPFLEDEDDDDLFGLGKSISKPSASKESTVAASSTKEDIFQDKTETTPKAHKKLKEKSIDASLFDDGVDIFADLTPKTKLKEKKAKKKVETKSIFDDDMDDIFSSGTSKTVAKPPSKAKKEVPVLDPIPTDDTNTSLFDDPLNVLGAD